MTEPTISLTEAANVVAGELHNVPIRYRPEARRLIDHARATAAPEIAERPVEIVTGNEAAELPDGSYIVVADEVEDRPRDKAIAHHVGHGGRLDLLEVRRWFVLYRAPEPVAPPAVGDTVETAAQLDALPVGTLVGYDGLRGIVREDDGGRDIAWADAKLRDVFAGIRVLDLGGES